MQLVVSGKNINLTNALKQYAEKKIGGVKRYFDHIIEVDVNLAVEDVRDQDRSNVCEVTVFANGSRFHAIKASEDMYASIDMVADRIERQIKKFKEKLKDRGRRTSTVREMDASHSVIAMPIEATRAGTEREHATDGSPKIIRTHKFAIKPMHVDEAAEQLQMLNQEFFVFSNAETSQVNVIYKRNDGNFGLIEPDFYGKGAEPVKLSDPRRV